MCESFVFQDDESDYANLPFQMRQQQQHQLQDPQDPQIEDGTFLKVLVDGLPWDVYLDKSKRKFFHNRETGEVTWKPPRKDKPSSPSEETAASVPWESRVST
jgi:hypothetical protein